MKTLHKYKSKDLTIQLFQIPIYDSKVCLLKYHNDNAYYRALDFAKKIGVDCSSYMSDDYLNAYGFVSKEKTKYGHVNFIFMNNCKEYKAAYHNTLSHENFHLVHNICKHHGIEFNDDSDNEPIAYLTGYLFELLSTL